MKLILRKQYVNYEPHEYEFLGPKPIDEIKRELEDFPWKEQIKLEEDLIGFHQLASFNLKYQNRELIITGLHNDNFSILYNHSYILQWQYQANMFDMKEVFDLMELFPRLSPRQFKRRIPTQKIIDESILSTLVISFRKKRKKIFSPTSYKEGKSFRMTPIRLLYYMSLSLIYLLFPIGLYLLQEINSVSIGFLFTQGIFIIITLPSFIISINHLRYNGNVELIFKRGENKFQAIIDSRSIWFDKKDIEKIIEVQSDASRAPWGLYEYYILKFKDDSELWLSCILIGSNDLYDQFYSVEKEFKTRAIPLIKKTKSDPSPKTM